LPCGEDALFVLEFHEVFSAMPCLDELPYPLGKKSEVSRRERSDSHELVVSNRRREEIKIQK